MDGAERKESITKSGDWVKINVDPSKWKIEHGQSKPLLDQATIRIINSKSSSLPSGKAKGNLSSQLRENLKLKFKANKHRERLEKDGGESQGEGGEVPSISKDSLEELSSTFMGNRGEEGRLRSWKTLENTSPKENKQFYDGLVKKVKMNLRPDGTSTASIRLRPQSLGHMIMNLEVVQKQVQAKIIVESLAAKKLVMEQLQSLQQELQQQGVQVESLSIRVRESSESMASRQSSQEEERQFMQMEKGDKDAMRQDDQRNLGENQKGNLDEEKMDMTLPSIVEEYETSQIIVSSESDRVVIDLRV